MGSGKRRRELGRLEWRPGSRLTELPRQRGERSVRATTWGVGRPIVVEWHGSVKPGCLLRGWKKLQFGGVGGGGVMVVVMVVVVCLVGVSFPSFPNADAPLP